MTVFDNPCCDRVYLVTVTPYDPATGAERTLYLSTHGFVTGPTENPANVGLLCRCCRAKALVYVRSMFTPDTLGGRSLPDRGALKIANADAGAGDLDAWLSYQWEGRSAVVRMGLPDWPIADFVTVMTGICGEIGYSRAEIVVPLKDRGSLLDKLAQDSLYAGTGGNEGGVDLKDKPKPICIGPVKNITPVPVDIPGRVLQVHDGKIEAIDAVYDSGKLLATPANYTVDLANGRFTLVADPAGLITADVQGSKSGGVYVSSVADVMQRLATEYSPLVTGDMEGASLAALNAAVTAPVGLYLGISPVNLLDAMDQVAGSVGGFFGMTRAGKFSVGRIIAPGGTPDLALGENDVVARSLARDPFGDVVWRRRVHYRRNWTPQNVGPAGRHDDRRPSGLRHPGMAHGGGGRRDH